MAAVYQTSHIKRHRATRAEMDQRADALVAIVKELAPCTVRQAFYQATVRNIVEKTEEGYSRVQRELVALRLSGRIKWDDIADNTRWVRRPQSYRSAADALSATAYFYRKDLWANADVHVEIWCEKDALAGIVSDITGEFDVPLYVARGYASLSYLHSAADTIRRERRPAYVYHCGDYDPSGQDAARKIEEKLREFAPKSEIHFERLAVLPSQIEEWNLPTRPTKSTDSRAKGFGSTSVELDAIDPHRLRAIVREAIERHLPPEQFEILKAAEESERAGMRAWANAMTQKQEDDVLQNYLRNQKAAEEAERTAAEAQAEALRQKEYDWLASDGEQEVSQ